MELPTLPLHQVILNHLKQEIENHHLKPGDKLPSEKELCGRFSVSRITVRKSLSELRALGMIHSVPGKGTFVTTPHIQATFDPLSSFSADMERRGYQVSSRVLKFSVVPANPETAASFRASPGTEVVTLERVRLLMPGSIPVAVQKVSLLHNRCPGITQFDMTVNSLYHILQSYYGLVLDRAEALITTRMSTQEEKELLELRQFKPLLLNTQTTYLSTGEIIELSNSVFRPDLYQLMITVEGGRASIQ